MANLSSLIHELRERIAASSSSSAAEGEDPLELRFRVVLPNLLHAYVVPSSSANEREVTAVLKLLSHTARNFPGVFFHGKATAVLPVLARVLPFLADPTFRPRHELIFETAATLLSLLRTGDRDAYRQFFLDAMAAVQDISYVASLHSDMMASRSVSLKCFCESLALISTSPALFSEVPACCRPEDGVGIVIDIGDQPRWRSFVVWVISLLSKCLTEGALYVEGNTVYDSSVGACFHVLHSACPDEVVKFTASEIVHIFPKSLQSTESPELQVALCSAYTRIARICPVYVWKPTQLISVLCSSSPCLSLIECIQMAASVLESIHLSNEQFVSQGMTLASGKEFGNAKVGEKRSAQNNHHGHMKRQRTQDMRLFPNVDVLIYGESTESSLSEENKKHVSELRSSLSKFLGFSRPEKSGSSSLRPETSIMGLSLLCIAFCRYPNANLSSSIFQQVFSWIPWICEQEKGTRSLSFGLSIYLDAINNILLLQGSVHTQMSLFKGDICLDDESRLSLYSPRYDDLIYLLKLPWTCDSGNAFTGPAWKIRCLSIQILSKIVCPNVECNLEVLDMAITDEAEQVRAEVAISFPVITLCSGYIVLEAIFRRLEYAYLL